MVYTTRTPVIDRLMAKVERVGDCWVWRGATCGVKDYGQIHVPADGPHRSRLVHRISYEVHVGEIPDGLQLDHLCGEPRCVNPWHLDPVPNAENMARRYAQITHCKWGHPRTPENRMPRTGACRPCHNRNTREWHRKRARLRREAT